MTSLDALQRVFDTVTHGTVLPEADQREAMIHRDPRGGHRPPDGLYEAHSERVYVVYSVAEHPPVITLVGVKIEDAE